MKKNAMLKIAAILLVAVLLTTCAISSTFAKYSTSKEFGNTETARVAKWGVDAAATFTAKDNIFLTSYGSGNAAAASANSTDLIVAPGTANSVTVSGVATGTPEVSGKIVITISAKLGEGWIGNDGSTFYCPVTINGQPLTQAMVSTKTKVTTIEKEFEANTDLSGVAFDDTIYWEWLLGDASLDDNALGNRNDTKASIQLFFDITIEQTGPAATLAP